MLSLKRASERNKTNILREEFVKMNRKYQRTHLPGEKSVSLGVFKQELDKTKSNVKTATALRNKIEESNHNVRQILSG